MEERFILAKALWETTTEERKNLIIQFNKELNEALKDINTVDRELEANIYESVERKFRNKALDENIMSLDLFEALDLAYDIMNE